MSSQPASELTDWEWAAIADCCHRFPDLAAKVPQLRAERDRLLVENKALAEKERREFAWAEEYMAKCRTLEQQWRNEAERSEGYADCDPLHPLSPQARRDARIQRECADELSALLDGSALSTP